MRNRILRALALVTIVALTPACIGLRAHPHRFFRDPEPGLAVIDMLTTYGKPDYTTKIDRKTVYVYRVVKDNYYLIAGSSQRFDLVVICEGGSVVETQRVDLGSNIAVLQPVTWQVN